MNYRVPRKLCLKESHILSPNISYRANGIPPPSDQYADLLRSWAQEKGIDLSSGRKRKSEDLSDAFKTGEDKPLYTKSVQMQTQKSGDFDLVYAKSLFVEVTCGEKDIPSFCWKAVNFLTGYMHLKVGGFYLNQRPNPKVKESNK